MTNKSTLSVALAFLKREPGFHLFPLAPGNKEPLRNFTEYNERASNDPAQLKQWAAEFSGCNWGIALAKSRLVPIDVDRKPDKVGEATFDALDAKHGFPRTFTVGTPNDGWHFYYRETDVVKYRLALGKFGFGPDIDVPPYILVPGCALRGGRSYTIVIDEPIADAPDWFAEYVTAREASADTDQTPEVELDQPGNVERAIHYLQHDAPPSIEGHNGEYTLLMVAAELKDMGVSEPKSIELLAEHYNVSKEERGDGKPHCDPLWMIGDGPIQDRLDVKVRNAWAYLNKHKPGCGTAEAEFAADPVPLSTPEEEKEQEKIRRANKKRMRKRLFVRPGKLVQAMATVQRIVGPQTDMADPVFKRRDKLVRLSRNLTDPDMKLKDYERDALLVADVGEHWFASRLERSIMFVGPGRGNPHKHAKKKKAEDPKSDVDKKSDANEKPKWVPTNCPMILVKRVLADATNWKHYRTLYSTLEAPTLRPDGTILSLPGYDVETGLFFDPGNVTFPPIPDRPSVEQGRAAMAMLDKVLVDFPFENDGGVSKSVAIAMMLTAVVRRTLDIAPAFGIDADDAEAGKTTLAKVAGALATGRDIAVHEFSKSVEEREKTLTAMLLTGVPVILYDNINDVIEGEKMEELITSAIFEGRPFGKNDVMRTAPTNALIIYTANKIMVAGNLTTRVLVSRLAPKVLLKDRVFQHRNLIGHVIENRPQLVAAILTALRSYIVHGKGTVQKDNDRFPQWSDLIRSAVIWYGYADPMRGGDKLRENDPIKEAQCEVLRRWWLLLQGESVTAAALLGHDKIREAIADGFKRRPFDVTSFMASPYIEKMIGIQLDVPVSVVKEPRRIGAAQRFHLELAEGESPDWVQADWEDTTAPAAAESADDFGPGSDLAAS